MESIADRVAPVEKIPEENVPGMDDVRIMRRSPAPVTTLIEDTCDR